VEGLIEGRDIGADLALTVLSNMRAEATKMGLGLAGCVTDRGGHVVASLRMDNAPLGALPIATDKAYTSALWGMPTSEAAEASLPGNGDWGFATTLGGRMIVFAGGVPIFHDRVQVGAFGISGGLSSEDEQCALAALAAAGLG
jgi:glc operon protein GlcG